ncbi:MipA/OmpV family protein [Psychrosphaera aquimarina]|uniref:MipA/OmpV family protein n=1 Tax=Psychrosphaera aquimarina TaxID=2044854 RepID=A0ABU3R486_9GAMM|nr:MipA/OmpV family protein [Psychrosphaera aquimarina]MDU0114489.1 MipA/OmpV family protein [Psychrosphaera aquimarina]
MAKVLLLIITFTFGICYSVYADNEVNDTENLKIDQFNISLSFGIGQRDQFVVGQDDLKLYLAPSISYYSTHLFFDNGTLGYTFSEQAQWAVSVITELNPYAKYFNHNHISNSFLEFSEAVPSPDYEGVLDSASGDQVITPSDNEYLILTKKVTTELMRKKRISLDGGIQLNYFLGSNQRIDFSLLHDISDLHNGYRFDLNWNMGFQFALYGQQPWRAKLGLGLDYLDANSANYYFGFSDENLETSYIEPYHPGHIMIPAITLNLSRKITKHLSLMLYFKHQNLNAQISKSPVITSDQINTSFIGLTYVF